jgi:hypothetical protein
MIDELKEKNMPKMKEDGIEQDKTPISRRKTSWTLVCIFWGKYHMIPHFI